MLKSIVIWVAIIILLMTGCTKTKPTSVHMMLGNPSNANSSNYNNYLMILPQYALSYNCQKGIPNWVSWQLNKSWLGSIKRQDEFKSNDNLPSDCYVVKPTDYSGSGYDRGHMTPSGDRTKTIADNEATFLMTNIIPQSPANNRDVWRQLEEYCRDLVEGGKELYIIAGGGDKKAVIAKSQVIVPKNTWKIVVILNKPEETVTKNTSVIAVKIPNSEKVAKTFWRDYLVSVDEIESDTGYDFLSNVPQSVQDVIEKLINTK